MPSASAAISRTMSAHVAAFLAGLALADEPGVLGKAAGVEEQWHAVRPHTSRRGPQVLEATRLAAAAVVGDRDEHDRHGAGRAASQERVEGLDVHVALERVLALRVATFGDHQIDRGRAGPLDVGARRVEVRVVRDGAAGTAEDTEEDLLGGPALMGRDDVRGTGTALAPRRGTRRTTASPRSDSSPRWMAAHWSRLIAPVPESVSRSMSTSPACRLKRL